tara:strand:+ start:4145 stop:4396 length:252 start_codon:yes stop_codon:yes gene_type:complete
MAMLISVEGEQTVVEPEESTFSLEELQKYVGGFIEIVPVDDSRMAVVNDEGFVRKMPMNSVGSQVAGRLLVGPVLLVNSNEIE